MAYTFGAATTNLISWTSNGVSMFSNNRTALVTCWVYPTTLTATRVIWGAGAIWRLAIDTTTSSCRLTADAVTDGAFTFPAGLALNTWTFIAVVTNCGAGPVMDVNVWTSTADGPLVKQTVTTVTAPVGTFSTSNLGFGVGNKATSPTLAFQGDIEAVAAFGESSGSVAGILGLIGDGSSVASRIDSLLDRLVIPLWRGDVSRLGWTGSLGIGVSNASLYQGLVVLAPLSGHLSTVKASSGGVILATNSGATVSARRCPRPFNMNNDTPFFNHRTRTPQLVA